MKDIFQQVICAVDDSDAGRVASALAARVTEPEGWLALVSVQDTSIAVHGGWQMAAVSAQVAGQAQAALDRGREIAEREHPVMERLRQGDPVRLSQHADLLVVGSRGLKGVRALGSVSELVAHQARCPVLVVRGR